MSDFYEDDEPVEDVVAAFDAGPHGYTAVPRQDFISPDGVAHLAIVGATLDNPTFCGQPMVRVDHF